MVETAALVGCAVIVVAVLFGLGYALGFARGFNEGQGWRAFDAPPPPARREPWQVGGHGVQHWR